MAHTTTISTNAPSITSQLLDSMIRGGEDIVDIHKQSGMESIKIGNTDALLQQSEERFRLLVEGVKDYAIFMLDPEGRIISWNAGAENIKGYKAEEIIGRHFSCFYPPDKLAQGRPAQALRLARAHGRVEDEGWRIRKDGSRFWANVIITALYDKDGRLRGFGKVTRDMTERKRFEALESAGKQMNEFLAMLAHELRNPLAPIRNAVNVMRIKVLEDPDLQWCRDVIDRQVAQLARLVDDLLDVNRIVSGNLMLQREPVELSVVIARAVESSRPLIDARQQTLEISLPAEPVWVEGDLARLTQVVINLLDNAAKYTPEGGHIWLAAGKEDGRAMIQIRDTGIGIPPDLLAKIFGLFTQGARTLDRSEGGLGIGLTLVQRIIELHGGSVAAFSEGINRGSEFTLWLPLLADPLLPVASPDPLPSLDSDTDSKPDPSSSPACRRVLVVDDNRDSVESLKMLLELWGHDVRSAYDGPTALAIAAEYRPRAVLLDIGLPGMNGYELAQGLRALAGLRDLLLIAITGYGQDEDRRHAQEAGIDYHLVKPVEAGELLKLLTAGAVAS
ncbi:MAG: ATP-binding protein [Candidatus Competibacteraceae bacterium]